MDGGKQNNQGRLDDEVIRAEKKRRKRTCSGNKEGV